mmetsp:Transcript_44537/g.133176  ORF Transcript_44537/g.133176 Transcript_44537/m.133176 type:complete len:274 (-) Transcript_44537:294-1115(-)
MARSALPKAVCDDVRNSAQAAYEATSRSRDAPGRVAQLTNVAMMPASTSPWPPQRLGVAGTLHERTAFPSVMMSAGPLEMSTGPPSAAAISCACCCQLLPMLPLSDTPTAPAMRPSSAMLGVTTQLVYPLTSWGSATIRLIPLPSTTNGMLARRHSLMTSRDAAATNGSSPMPGPTTRHDSFRIHGRISAEDLSTILLTSASGGGSSKTGRSGSSGMTMRSGLNVLMTMDADSVQKTNIRSAPTLLADMAAKKGAPVYSRQPPRMPTLPCCPL